MTQDLPTVTRLGKKGASVAGNSMQSEGGCIAYKERYRSLHDGGGATAKLSDEQLALVVRLVEED